MGRNKQATCKICYKEMRSDHIKQHMKVHLKYKPRVQILEKGVQTDSNSFNDCNFEAVRKDKSWLCDLCGYQTDRKDKLKRHIESIHQNIKYECNQCKFVTKRKDSLRRHQKIKHGGSVPEKETRIIDQVNNDLEGRNMQVTCKESDHLPKQMKVQVQNDSKIPYKKNTEDSNNMDELMKESIEVWKIYKLLQRMKKN